MNRFHALLRSLSVALLGLSALAITPALRASSAQPILTDGFVAQPEKDAPKKDDAKKDDANKDQPKTEDKKDDAKKDEAKSDEPVKKKGVTRVAVLNFGAPSSWQGEIGSTVGSQITARSFAAAVPMLEADKIDLVVVRINSGGGALSEMEPFQNLFQNVYKKKFMTVGWVESAISCAAMSPWPIEDFYFMPNGNMGACTGWFGPLIAVKGVELEMVLAQMEKVSAMANRSPYIMRSMQIQEPLSCDIDEQGNVIWRQDRAGEHILNDTGRILTLTADDAVKFKFAKGKAATLEELMKVIGIQEWELAGKKASDYIDKSMREADKAEKRLIETIQKYLQAVEYAESQQDKKRRAEFVGRAKRSLKEAENLYKANPNHAQQYRLTPDWFREQEKLLKKLLEP